MEIKRTKVVLQYRKSTSGYFKENYNPFVAIDSNSGGYPYEEYIERAYDFKTVDAAKKYDCRNEFDVRILAINYRVDDFSEQP